MFSKTYKITLNIGLLALVVATGCDDGLTDAETTTNTARKAGPNKSVLVDKVRDFIEEYGIEPIPAAPPVSEEMFTLGQALSFDKILSGNNNISCLTCHHPTLGSDDDRHLPLGEGGVGLGADRQGGPIIPRSAPPLFNLHTYETMFWDSRVEPDGMGGFVTPAGDQLTPEMLAVLQQYGLTSIQAMFPVTSREEMRGHEGNPDNELGAIADDDFTGIWGALMARLGTIEQYVEMFEAAYPGTAFEDMTFAHAANAIGAFEIAAFASQGSRWNLFVEGDDHALSKKQLRGAVEFFEAGCAECHSGTALSDFEHHNTGLAQFGPGKGDGPEPATGPTDDFGRERVTGALEDRYAFRTTPLFNVAETGPYGHDGQFRNLREFIAHYDNPEESLQNYDITKNVNEPALWDLLVDNTEQILNTLSPQMDDVDLSGKTKLRVKRIKNFLKAMTDYPLIMELDQLVPPSVPSGLPVAD